MDTCSAIEREDYQIIKDDYDFSLMYGKTIFITGATGVIGRQIIQFLLYLNEKDDASIKILALVRDLDKAKMTFGKAFTAPLIHWKVGDVLSVPVIDDKIDFIIHGASITSSKAFVEQPVETIKTSVNGTMNILDFARQHHVTSMVYLSTMEVFGVTDKSLQSISEKDYGYMNILKPRSSYPESKRLCECMCVGYHSEYDLPVRIARLALTFGPGMDVNDQRVAAYFARCVIRKNDIILKTDGSVARPILYTSDAVSAILMILLKGCAGEAYNAANPETCITIKQTAEMIINRLASNKIKLVFDIPQEVPLEYKETQGVVLPLSVEKLTALGWRPRVGVQEAYRRLISSFGVFLPDR